jgi:large subunit ribosomal protein L5
MSDKNPMQSIHLDKVVVNIGVGQNENLYDNAKALIKKLTNHEARQATSKKRDPELKLRKGQVIGAVATLRKEDAELMLKRSLEANGNVLSKNAIANNSVNLGVKEYIYFTGVKYDPKIGILGLNVNASFARKGKRVELRKRKSSKVGRRHREIRREEIEGYLESRFKVRPAE